MCFRTARQGCALSLLHVGMTQTRIVEYPSSDWGARNTTVAWLAVWYVSLYLGHAPAGVPEPPHLRQ